MSVAMTNCGAVGWVTDAAATATTPPTRRAGGPGRRCRRRSPPWRRARRRAGGFEAFAPDACLINRYEPGARLSLHQDRDERDLDAPIVSVSLGLPAMFLFGGLHRGDPLAASPLTHGDVVVWGGPARLRITASCRSRTASIR